MTYEASFNISPTKASLLRELIACYDLRLTYVMKYSNSYRITIIGDNMENVNMFWSDWYRYTTPIREIQKRSWLERKLIKIKKWFKY